MLLRLSLLCLFALRLTAAETYDVVVYGGTSAGVIAAVQAKKMGKSVGIFVFRRHVGGMSSSGLSDVDYGKKESIGGMAKTVFLDFFKKQVQSPAEVETLLGDPSKAKTILGWEPEITVEEMCAEMVAADLDEARRHALLKSYGHHVSVSKE